MKAGRRTGTPAPPSVATPISDRWTDTPRGETFTLTTLSLRRSTTPWRSLAGQTRSSGTFMPERRTPAITYATMSWMWDANAVTSARAPNAGRRPPRLAGEIAADWNVAPASVAGEKIARTPGSSRPTTAPPPLDQAVLTRAGALVGLSATSRTSLPP
jgi:hypothetical protein